MSEHEPSPLPLSGSSPPPVSQRPVRLTIVPVSLGNANLFVEKVHRHSRQVQGAKLCVGVADESGFLRGVAIVGRPIARMLQDGVTLEVTRCCTDGAPNACSMLYNAARAAAFAQGYRRLITYTLQSESMRSLKAAGWKLAAEVDAYERNGWLSRPGRINQAVSHVPKYRWETSMQGKRRQHALPVVLPWKCDEAPRRVLSPPETLVFTGRGNEIDVAVTVVLTAHAATQGEGGFSAWDAAFAVEIEILKAGDCQLSVANPPTLEQVDRALHRFALAYPDILLRYGCGWYSWLRVAHIPPLLASFAQRHEEQNAQKGSAS